MRPHPMTVIVALAAVLGFAFAAVSTYDFVAHLDRQVHGIHCSFIPGIGAADASGSSGCHVTMMSPYSSVLRQSIWGGIPISLPAMSVFAFIFFWSLWLVLRRRQRDPRATLFLWLATILPVLASIVMAIISFRELGAACKLCIGIYASSFVAFVAAGILWFLAGRAARQGHVPGQPATASQTVEGPSVVGWGLLAAAFAFGVAFVALPVVAYAARAPDYSRFVGSCGELAQPNDPHRVLLPIGSQSAGADTIEVLDPLCPSCRAFERRLDASGLHDRLKRKVLLFPLDNTCNWMVDSAIHPGACSISEAMLCADERAEEVLAWAFEEQERIVEAARSDPRAAERLVEERFPNLRQCVGSPGVRAKLNRALRWAVDNRLPVLTPQVYVNGTRMCDEDTDLGMDYALSRMLDGAGAQRGSR